MEDQLSQLTNYVRQAFHKGEFLLSVNRFSDSWIYLPVLNVKPVRDLVQSIFRNIFLRILEDNPDDNYIIFAPEFIEASEKEFPTGIIAQRSFRSINSPRLKFVNFKVDQTTGQVTLTNKGVVQGRKCIGMFALSIHVDLMKSIISYIRDLGGEVSAIVAIGERENVSRGVLDSLGVDLIPLILFDPEKREVTHALAKIEEPYIRYHKFFHKTAT
jgi:hypothetical protein